MTTPPDTSDELQLIAAAQAGDQAAFAALYAAHRTVVVTRISYLHGPSGSIDDLVQDTFIRAFRALPRFRAECPFRAWLLRIATRTATSEHRSLRRSIWRLFTGDEEQAATRMADAAPDAELYPDLRALYAALDRLSPRLREAVVLFDLEGRSLVEIAADLDVPLNTVAARVRRGRESLRKHLDRSAARVERPLLPCPGDAR